MDGASTSALDDPILNTPYDPPGQHFEIGHQGPTGKVFDGRRPSGSFIPVPAQKKSRRAADQQALDFDAAGSGGRRTPSSTTSATTSSCGGPGLHQGRGR